MDMQLNLAVSHSAAPAPLSASAWGDELAQAAIGPVLLIGQDTLELTCVLIRLGCPAVAELAGNDRCQRREAETVIAPHIATAAAAEHAIAHAARALVPTGRLVLALSAPTAPQVLEVERLLARYGFADVRLATKDGLHVSAVLPTFGLHRSANHA